MNSHLQRAQLLYHQARYDLAEQELRQSLAERPHEAVAHALLGLCLMRQDKLPDAQAETEQAIGLAPDDPYPHYCRSVVFSHRNRFAEAEKSAREAIALAPESAGFHAQLAAVLFQQQKWQAAYDTCLQGLRFDAEDVGCNNLRSMALTKLGRQAESIATVDESLSRDPDNEMAHANKGWALLHQGKPKPALVHFREALRLDPNYEYAKSGMIEALKARNPLYRWILGYFLWMARLEGRTRWAIVIGGYVGYRVLGNIAREHPELAPGILPLLVIYLVFALLTWFAVPLFNLLLRFNKFGRFALSRDQRASSNWFALCLVVLLVAIVVGLTTPIDTFLIGFFPVGMALPLVTTYYCDTGWPRKYMALATLAMAGVGLAMVICNALGLEITKTLFTLFLLGFIATPWLANYLAGVTPER